MHLLRKFTDAAALVIQQTGRSNNAKADGQRMCFEYPNSSQQKLLETP
jgi:hypothetical protein